MKKLITILFLFGIAYGQNVSYPTFTDSAGNIRSRLQVNGLGGLNPGIGTLSSRPNSANSTAGDFRFDSDTGRFVMNVGSNKYVKILTSLDATSGGALSGLTSGRIPVANSSTTVNDFSTLTYVSGTGLSIGDKLLFPLSGGSTPGIYNPNSSNAGFSVIYSYPQSGTNIGNQSWFIPKGTGQSGDKADILLLGTDYIADATNYELLLLRATGAQYSIASLNGGTGTVRPIVIYTGANTTQFTLNTDGSNSFGGVQKPAVNVTSDLGTASLAWRQLFLGAGTTTTTQINLAAGTAKTSPAQGDLFAVTGHLYYRDGSTTYDLLSAGSSTSNTFTSTLTNTTNIASNSFLSANYIQVGNIAHCRISGTMTPTAGGSASTMTFTLPVSTATTTQSRVGAGSYFNSSNIPQGVLVDIVSGTTGTITFFPTNTGTGDWAIEFDYKTN